MVRRRRRRRRTHQGAGVGGVGRVVLQEARQAEVRHLADQVAVDQDVAGGQVAVDVVHVTQVLHPRRDASQHAHQLDHRELPVVLLWGGAQGVEDHRERGAGGRGVCEFWWVLYRVLNLIRSFTLRV